MDIKFLNQISGKRILKTVEEIHELAAGPKGDRIAYGFSHVEDAIFKYIKSYAYELNKGYTVLTRNLDFYEDAFGNLYVILDSDKDNCVAMATHVDGVDKEGNMDGYLGAAVGLEIMRVFFEQEISLKKGYCLMVFRAGEAEATGVGNLGSKVAARRISKEELQAVEYGVEKKVPIESVLKYKKMNLKKIYDGLDTGYIYEGRYSCLLELHEERRGELKNAGQSVGVAVDCGACSEKVVDVVEKVYEKVIGEDGLTKVSVEDKFDADSFSEVMVPTGVVLVDSLKNEASVELGAKLLAGTLGVFGV